MKDATLRLHALRRLIVSHAVSSYTRPDISLGLACEPHNELVRAHLRMRATVQALKTSVSDVTVCDVYLVWQLARSLLEVEEKGLVQDLGVLIGCV